MGLQAMVDRQTGGSIQKGPYLVHATLCTLKAKEAKTSLNFLKLRIQVLYKSTEICRIYRGLKKILFDHRKVYKVLGKV